MEWRWKESKRSREVRERVRGEWVGGTKASTSRQWCKDRGKHLWVSPGFPIDSFGTQDPLAFFGILQNRRVYGQIKWMWVAYVSSSRAFSEPFCGCWGSISKRSRRIRNIHFYQNNFPGNGVELEGRGRGTHNLKKKKNQNSSHFMNTQESNTLSRWNSALPTLWLLEKCSTIDHSIIMELQNRFFNLLRLSNWSWEYRGPWDMIWKWLLVPGIPLASHLDMWSLTISIHHPCWVFSLPVHFYFYL